MEAPQEIKEQEVSSVSEREKCRAAGISWPPKPWQRVEINNTRPVLGGISPLAERGTVISWDGEYFLVLSDDAHAACPAPRQCLLSDLWPVFDTKTPGWVPVAVWKEHLFSKTNPEALDLKLTSGRLAFDCWPQRKPPAFFYFTEQPRPHRRYTEHDVAAVRPEGA